MHELMSQMRRNATGFSPQWRSLTLSSQEDEPRPDGGVVLGVTPVRWLKKLALGPVSRILFCTLRRFSRHFSHACLAADLASCDRLREHNQLQHTRGYGTGRPATYFALHRKGFFVPPTLPLARWALTPPFHPHQRETSPRWQFVFCDTVRRHALTRAAHACGEACAASCPAVSGLSSPNFYRARVSPHLGIKELGATTKPQS